MADRREFEFEGAASPSEAADALSRIADGIRSRALSLSRLLTSRPAVRSIPRPMERPRASCVRTDGGT